MKRDGVNSTGGNGRPWTEAEWERFIRAQDRIGSPPSDWPIGDLEAFRELGMRPTDLVAPHEEPSAECASQIRFIPAFRFARDFVAEIDSHCHELASTTAWSSLQDEARRVAYHIASGHGLGYEDSHICGNIVKCRDALHSIEQSIALLQTIQAAGSHTGVEQLLITADFVREALHRRIATLRARVWWDGPSNATH